MANDFIYSKEMTKDNIERFNKIISSNRHFLDTKYLEGKTVQTTGYPLNGSFQIGENVSISSNPNNPNAALVVCYNYTMFDNLALLAGENQADRQIIQKIVENWETVKNFVEMLDS